MTGPQKTEPRDTKTELLEAARSAIRNQAEKAREQQAPPPGPSRIGRGMLALVGVTGLVLLLTRPAWLVGPDRPPPEPPAVVAASLRLTLLRERQRILKFIQENGRLPTALAETGSSADYITFRPMPNARFELTALAGDSVITLRSDDSISTFLGTSLRALRRRGGR